MATAGGASAGSSGDQFRLRQSVAPEPACCWLTVFEPAFCWVTVSVQISVNSVTSAAVLQKPDSFIVSSILPNGMGALCVRVLACASERTLARIWKISP